MSTSTETRVEFSRSVWKSNRKAIKAWLAQHAPTARWFSTFYFDGQQMSGLDAQKQLNAVQREHSTETGRQACEMSDKHGADVWDWMTWPDEFAGRLSDYLDKRMFECLKLKDRRTSKFWFAFENASDAVLFKLTWGGAS